MTIDRRKRALAGQGEHQIDTGLSEQKAARHSRYQSQFLNARFDSTTDGHRCTRILNTYIRVHPCESVVDISKPKTCGYSR